MPKNTKYTRNEAQDAAGELLQSASGNVAFAYNAASNTLSATAPAGTEFPADTVAALAGTSGTPSATNKFVTSTDPRLLSSQAGQYALVQAKAWIRSDAASGQLSGYDTLAALLVAAAQEDTIRYNRSLTTETVTGRLREVWLDGQQNTFKLAAGGTLEFVDAQVFDFELVQDAGGVILFSGTKNYVRGGVLGIITVPAGVSVVLDSVRFVAGVTGPGTVTLQGTCATPQSVRNGTVVVDLRGGAGAGGYDDTPLKSRVTALETGKVDKAADARLLTQAEASKLAGLKNYSEGTGISIAADGTISATGGGSGSGYDDSAIKSRVTAVETSVAGKVDKVAGKGLTDVNFSLADKQKLDSLQNSTATSYDDTVLKNRVSALETGKVDKVAGKGLTDVNFSLADKQKLDSLQNATPYTLPAATSTTLGGVKAGSNISIAADGTISSTATSGGSSYDDTALRNRVSAVESGKLSNGFGTVEGYHLADDTILTRNFTDHCITGQQLAAGAVEGTHIADDTIQTRNLAQQCVTTATIGNGQVTKAKLSAELQQTLNDMNYQVNRVYFRAQQDDLYSGVVIDRSQNTFQLPIAQGSLIADPAGGLRANGDYLIARAGTYQVNLSCLLRYKDLEARPDFVYKIGVTQNDPTGTIADQTGWLQRLVFKNDGNANGRQEAQLTFSRFYEAGTVLRPAIYVNNPTAAAWTTDREVSVNWNFSLLSL